MFSFPNQQQVWGTAAWADFLDGRAGNQAGKIERWQLCGAMETESNIEIVRRVVYSRNPTRTGQMLYDFCKKVSSKIHFIGWRMGGGGDGGVARPGFSSFENDCPILGQATIYLNLDLALQVLNPSDPNPNKILNGYIILLHEMGHAVHWLRFGSSRFDTMTAKDDSRTQRVSGAQKEVRDVIMKQPGPYSAKRKLIEEAVLNKVGHADYYGKQFPSELELLNWVEHEGPICDDWGIARRPAYTAIREVW